MGVEKKTIWVTIAFLLIATATAQETIDTQNLKLLWSKETSDITTGDTILAVQLQDGESGIIQATEEGRIQIQDQQRKTLWSYDCGKTITSIVLEDLDGDGKPEITAQTHDGRIYVFGIDKTTAESTTTTPTTTTTTTSTSTTTSTTTTSTTTSTTTTSTTTSLTTTSTTATIQPQEAAVIPEEKDTSLNTALTAVLILFLALIAYLHIKQEIS